MTESTLNDASRGEEEEQQPEAEGVEDLPELLELIDAAEEAKDDASKLASVLRNIGRRIRETPGDRDLLSDFEGVSQICQALSEPPHSWNGEAMLAFCKVMPDVCRQSLVNRGSLRDCGFLEAAVELLRSALKQEDEAVATAACTALCALCTASDGNKQAAAMLFPDLPEGEEPTEAEPKRGALFLLLDAVDLWESVAFQTEAVAALRSLVVDDDNRKSEVTPAAVENREVALTEELFPKMKEVAQRALAAEGSQVRLTEQGLLLLREIARGQDRIQDLAKPSSKLLPKVLTAVEADDARVVRAALSVLRAFAFCEDVRDELSLSMETQRYARTIKKHLATPVVCEQGFGLIANLVLRNPSMASFLNDGDHEIIALGQVVLNRHPDRCDVAKSVIQLLWSVSRQNEKALAEVRELELFPVLRHIAGEHKEDKKWHGAVDVTMNFLREFREDEGLQKKPVYNAYY